jgi:hypothetical protein
MHVRRPTHRHTNVLETYGLGQWHGLETGHNGAVCVALHGIGFTLRVSLVARAGMVNEFTQMLAKLDLELRQAREPVQMPEQKRVSHGVYRLKPS